MKHFASIILAASLLVVPAQAEEDIDEGLGLLEQGAKIILRNLLSEMDSTLDELDLEKLAEELGPMMLELQGAIGDMTQYHLPEVLPNGDIIIRRKIPHEVIPPGEDGEIEL